MIPKVFTLAAHDAMLAMTTAKSSDAAFELFVEFVDACYQLNGVRPVWRGRFDNILNKELVDRVCCDFLFHSGVSDIEKPLRHFKAWRLLATNNWYSLMAVGAVVPTSHNFKLTSEHVFNILKGCSHKHEREWSTIT